MEKVALIFRKVLIALLIIWMIVVFCFSQQDGEASGGLSEKVSSILCFGNVERAQNLEPIIRKVAHVLEYAIGAMIFYGIMITYPKLKLQGRIAFTAIFILAFAGLDEFHQTFIENRNGTIKDVGIDFVGGTLGVGACYVIERMIRMIDQKVQDDIKNGK